MLSSEVTSYQVYISKKQILYLVLASLLISVLTFPDLSPYIVTGLDGSQNFGLNYLYLHHLGFGSQVVFTYGPLGFVTAPICMGHNLPITIAIILLVKFFFIFSFLLLGIFIKRSITVLNLLLALGLSSITYIDMFLIGGVMLACFIYDMRGNKLWLLTACLITVLAMFIKASYGIICTSVIGSYVIYQAITVHRYKLLLLTIVAGFVLFLFEWFLLYHNFSGLCNYLRMTIDICRDNSNAMQLEAKNHWLKLLLALLVFYLPYFFTSNRNIKMLYIIMSVGLYLSFRYSFAREEGWHEKFLFNYVLMMVAFTILIRDQVKILSTLLLFIAPLILHANMVKSGTYSLKREWNIQGIHNFKTYVVDYKSTTANATLEDKHLLESEKLDAQQRTIIGNNTVDVFPGELNYVAANYLNWQPRPRLQSGYAYTPLLDENNTAFLGSDKAPKYVIWVLEQPPINNYSFDDRYLLNDDPRSIYALFDHHKIINISAKTVLFEHTNNDLLTKEQSIKTTIGNLNQWLDVPPTDSNIIVRAHVTFSNTFKGVLRKTFYKDQLYFIDYKLADGTIKTYRFIPANADGGLWINPLVLDTSKGLKGETVKAIRIWVSRTGLVDDSFSVDWRGFQSAH